MKTQTNIWIEDKLRAELSDEAGAAKKSRDGIVEVALHQFFLLKKAERFAWYQRLLKDKKRGRPLS